MLAASSVPEECALAGTWRRSVEPFTRPLFFAVSRATRGMTLGVRGLVTNAEGHVLLIEHTYLHGWWLPGGGVDRGETAEQAVIRELREEAGVEVQGRPRLLSVHSNERFFKGDHVLVFRVTDWTPTQATSHGEIADVRFFPPDALPETTNPASRRRIAEALFGAEPEPTW
ncbi:NUDIX domain-containing protein [Caulobacter sp. 17J80-11]|uniref:NUDIX domain-containing protein n=1 Tax=Caulobacter sp. 17J80-11 TaxID=2763502 RepID=UPI001653680F|nr:NUDIX domain-containing protein [Caulobacter sp. 17J80-11]